MSYHNQRAMIVLTIGTILCWLVFIDSYKSSYGIGKILTLGFVCLMTSILLFVVCWITYKWIQNQKQEKDDFKLSLKGIRCL
jgi:amino acid permease